eukprot:c5830_g1_i2.p1 GENE.c5830_g1_i2~~c5830_g1_i2.p1  ORF type:complete len:393 (+),score=41.10 c5830_g1_i2:148-1179(+)
MEMSEKTSHVLAHKLQGQEVTPKRRGRSKQQVPPEPPKPTEAEKKRKREEEESFLRLQRRFGFAPATKRSAIGYAAPVPGSPVRSQCVRGLIRKLSHCLALSMGECPKNVRRSVSVCVDTDFFPCLEPSTAGAGDRGWGCGYRNIQMLLSSVADFAVTRGRAEARVYHEALSKLVGPEFTLGAIQTAIEESWKRGFDASGGKQLGWKLHETTKWIGASEVVALLSCAGVRTQVYDFNRDKAPMDALRQFLTSYFFSDTQTMTRSHTRNSHPPAPHNEASCKCHESMCCGLPPLYLQHDGHSRTIVGMVREWRCDVEQEPILLIFDPSYSAFSLERTLSTQRGW